MRPKKSRGFTFPPKVVRVFVFLKKKRCATDFYRVKNSISEACLRLPLQCSKKAALACLTGASAPGTTARRHTLNISQYFFNVSKIYFCKSFKSPTLRDKFFTAVRCLSFLPMFHPAPSQSTAYRPIGASLQELRPVSSRLHSFSRD